MEAPPLVPLGATEDGDFDAVLAAQLAGALHPRRRCERLFVRCQIRVLGLTHAFRRLPNASSGLPSAGSAVIAREAL